MTFSQGSGMNCVWLPDTVNDPEWYNYKVEVTAVKTGGTEGFLVGAGAKDASNYYWYNIGGWENERTDVERCRDGSKVTLGNNYGANYIDVVVDEAMDITFNYGADNKLQAYYTTATGIEVFTLDGYIRPYQNEIYQVSSMDDIYIYMKLVNHDTYSKYITLNYPGIEPERPELPYKDVAATDWFYDAVAYTYYERLMTGMNDETFGPYGQLSRAQFALMLYRMEGTPSVQQITSHVNKWLL